jgi:hypothetical protein
MNEGTCKSCGAAIVWAVTERVRKMPLSVASEQRRFVLTEDGIARSIVTYDSHFSDCPHADQHRTEP